MTTSDKIDLIAAALVAAQKKLKNPAFDCVNPHFKSKYVSLAALRDGTLPVLVECGVSVTQELHHDAQSVGCTTILMHESGQWMRYGPFFVPLGKIDAQTACAASTYARRYSWQAALGVVGDEDDDGNAATKPPQKPPEPAPPAREPDEAWIAPLCKAVVEKKDKAFVANLLKVCGWKTGVTNGGLSEDGLLRLKEALETVIEGKK